LNRKTNLNELRNECDILFNDINSEFLNLENIKEKFEIFFGKIKNNKKKIE